MKMSEIQSPKDLAPFIDHTILKAQATSAQVQRLCAEAVQYGFASVCVNTAYTELVCRELKGSGVKTCVVAGFPLGACTTAAKAAETAEAVTLGADEVDMVINIGRLLDGDTDYVENDIRAVVDAAAGRVVKVIIEACYLNRDEIVSACLLAEKAGAHFVKTSTGFGPSGATVDDVALMKKTVPSLQVKAAGGIRDTGSAMAMLEAGADRIGASASISIIGEG